MTTKHTPGQLQAIHGSYLTIVGTNESIGRCGSHGPHMENARRLAACWNACIDVPTDTLEQNPAPFSELRAERDTLRNQSEDRRAQIERMSGYLHTCGPNCTKAGCVNGRLSERLTHWESAIGAVMMPDLKDWHDNDPAEWPDIAAGVITTLREQRDEEVELSGQLATQLATKEGELATLRAQVEALHLRLMTAEDGAKEAARAEDIYVKAERLLTADERSLHDEVVKLRAQVEALTSEVQETLLIQQVIESVNDHDETMFQSIEHEARRSFRRSKSGARGQAVSRSDSYESHLIWAALAWAKEHPTPSPLTRPAVPSDDAILAIAAKAGLSEFVSRTDRHELGNELVKFGRALLASAPQPPVEVGDWQDTLYLLRRLISNQHTFTGPEFRAELTKIVGEVVAAAPQPEAQKGGA